MFSALALVGGSHGAMLCLHEAGVFHVTARPEAEHEASSEAAVDACEADSVDPCDWCLDVEVKGLDLAEVRFEEDGELFDLAPAVSETVPTQVWEVPAATSFSSLYARAPPADPQALIVTRKTVLLI